MRRILSYFLAWLLVIGTLVIARFTVFSGTASDDRFALAVGAMAWTAAVLMGSHAYESRRLALLCNLRGRGALGYLRGWVKSAFVEVALNDDHVPSAALREWRLLRLGSGYVFFSLIIVIPVLLF
ncbi:MAG: hypothetical protein ABI837_11540 [Acidobacteriota bacterium]